MKGDDAFMKRALELARAGVGETGENPSVGCVVVRGGVIIAEGATGKGGRPHAEEKALAGVDALGGTAYITLEPCAERSNRRVDSCATRLQDAGIARVVIAASDPSPLAKGRGVALLRAAGIKVELGLMEAEALAQDAAYFKRWA